MKKNGVIFIVGTALILGVGMFVFLRQKAVPTVSPEIKKAQEEILANCKYDKEFCKYMTNGIIAMSSGYTMTSESNYNKSISKIILKSDGKENSESISYADGKEDGSFVSLNKTTYMKGPGETIWTEFPPTKDETGKPTANLFDFEGLKKELGDVAKEANESLVVKKLGVESCDKLNCVIFEMKDTSTPDLTTKIWVDTQSYFARKMETKTKEGVSTMTFEYGPVTITKPSPVKKMPTFDTIVPEAGVDLNSEEIQKMMKTIPQTNTQEQAPPEEMSAE